MQVDCPKCGESGLIRKGLPEHLASHCWACPVACPNTGCRAAMPPSAMERHLLGGGGDVPPCAAQQLTCRGCGGVVPRCRAAEHADVAGAGACPSRRACPFRVYGCGFVGTADEVREHAAAPCARAADRAAFAAALVESSALSTASAAAASRLAGPFGAAKAPPSAVAAAAAALLPGGVLLESAYDVPQDEEWEAGGCVEAARFYPPNLQRTSVDVAPHAEAERRQTRAGKRSRLSSEDGAAAAAGSGVPPASASRGQGSSAAGENAPKESLSCEEIYRSVIDAFFAPPGSR